MLTVFSLTQAKVAEDKAEIARDSSAPIEMAILDTPSEMWKVWLKADYSKSTLIPSFLSLKQVNPRVRPRPLTRVVRAVIRWWHTLPTPRAPLCVSTRTASSLVRCTPLQSLPSSKALDRCVLQWSPLRIPKIENQVQLRFKKRGLWTSPSPCPLFEC